MEETVSAALDPRVIEQEIATIREREATPYSAGTKATLFTLIILRRHDAVAPGAADHVEGALQYLLGRRPARIITITDGEADGTEAFVSGRCFPDKRNRGVCFEEVRIESGRDGLGRDPGTWAPLVLRDLPVYVWMPEAGRDDAPWGPTLRQAAGIIDKLFVDSSRAVPADEPPEATLAFLRSLRTRIAGIPLFADFAWRRGQVLREQSARVFDPQEMRPLLSAISRVRMYGGSRAEAALFFRWLETRLGRKIRAEHPVEGALTEGFRITFFPEGSAEVDIGCTRGGCLSRGEEKSAYRFPADGEILLSEVDALSRDPVFQGVLADA
jgi:hypothetical protein